MDVEGIRRRHGVRAANNLLAVLHFFVHAWYFLSCTILITMAGISFLSVLLSAVSTDVCHHQESAQKWENLEQTLFPGDVWLFRDAENNFWMGLYPQMTDGTVEEFSCAVDLRSPIPTLCFAFLPTIVAPVYDLYEGHRICKRDCFIFFVGFTAFIDRPTFYIPVALMLYLMYILGQGILVAWHVRAFPARGSLYKKLCQRYNVF